MKKFFSKQEPEEYCFTIDEEQSAPRSHSGDDIFSDIKSISTKLIKLSNNTDEKLKILYVQTASCNELRGETIKTLLSAEINNFSEALKKIENTYIKMQDVQKKLYMRLENLNRDKNDYNP